MIQFDNFFSHGYILHCDENINVSKYDSYTFPDCTKSEEEILKAQGPQEKAICQLDLQVLHEYLAKNYVSKLFANYDIMHRDLWCGVDEGSVEWHNDHEDGDPFNSTILVYMDDNTPENGNFIAVRGPAVETILYPKRGEFIWLNQKKIFQHKAKHNSGVRRVLGFEFFVHDLK